jgi:hypothetical protein
MRRPLAVEVVGRIICMILQAPKQANVHHVMEGADAPDRLQIEGRPADKNALSVRHQE